jgi:peptidoglycan/xylan/chitin deacetylase (PgdA/CDA1 family)
LENTALLLVVITFDDGFRSCIEHSVPILETSGYCATYLVVGGLVGQGSR